MLNFGSGAQAPAPSMVQNKVYPVGEKAPTKKHVSAAEAAKFLREREGMQHSPDERVAWIIRQVARGIRFDGCGATDCNLGVYVGAKYARVCHRCKGKGKMDAADKSRHMMWAATRSSGDRRTYHDYNEFNMFGVRA